MTVCHRVSASVREITASGCRVFCKRATRGQLLPFLWNNKDGRPQSISLPENTALKIFGPDIRSCVWVCHCWTLCSKRQCQGGFHSWIPLEAQLHRTTPKTIREHLPALCNTYGVIVWFRVYGVWLPDCCLVIAHGEPGKDLTHTGRGTELSCTQSFRMYHFLCSLFTIFILSSNLRLVMNEKLDLSRNFYFFFGLYHSCKWKQLYLPQLLTCQGFGIADFSNPAKTFYLLNFFHFCIVL